MLEEVSYTTETTVDIWYMVASWTREVNVILKQKRLLHCFFE